MKCPQCGYNNRARAAECENCNATLEYKSIAKITQAPFYDREKVEAMHHARYECERYRLAPQGVYETDQQFIKRVNVEKTPFVLAEHRKILEAWDRQGIKGTHNPMFAKLDRILKERRVAK